ncbi:putative stearoyl-CoA 9-desaturase [Microsporum audouinii]
MSLLSLWLAGVSITAGYHRLWSHKSYQASTPLQYFFAIWGASSCQWSILWWVRHHRSHHQYLDTDKDPYNAPRGLLYSHIGWLIGLNPEAWGEVDISDLESSPVVRWQKKYYVLIAILVALFLPVTIAHFGWNDGLGAFVYCALLRTNVMTQSTFLVNSISHAPWAGTQPYSDASTATNVPLVGFIAAGEGNHNFHHAFPRDYRAGVHWHELDVTQWFIWVCAKLGLAWDLQTTNPVEIKKALLRQKDRAQGVVQELPVMGWGNYLDEVSHGRRLVCIDGIIHDITGFIKDHPGGEKILQEVIGTDATNAFYDGHPHSLHAEATMAEMSIAIVRR